MNLVMKHKDRWFLFWAPFLRSWKMTYQRYSLSNNNKNRPLYILLFLEGNPPHDLSDNLVVFELTQIGFAFLYIFSSEYHIKTNKVWHYLPLCLLYKNIRGGMIRYIWRYQEKYLFYLIKVGRMRKVKKAKLKKHILIWL